MIGNRISENDFWECYLLLLDILQVCTARILSHGLTGYLEALISDHHLFVRCYTEDNFIPKMHYGAFTSANYKVKYYFYVLKYNNLELGL